MDGGKWAQIVGLSMPWDGVFGGSLGVLVGAWFGAVPIPLDWYDFFFFSPSISREKCNANVSQCAGTERGRLTLSQSLQERISATLSFRCWAGVLVFGARSSGSMMRRWRRVLELAQISSGKFTKYKYRRRGI